MFGGGFGNPGVDRSVDLDRQRYSEPESTSAAKIKTTDYEGRVIAYRH
jgi:hypothetical protein